jgi:hypothetical protein
MSFTSVTASARLLRLIDELQSADKHLKTDSAIAGSVLRELRQALDNLRLTAWTLSELQNARETNKDTAAMTAFLTAERLRRLRSMIDALCSDLERDGGSWPSICIHDLQESVSSLRERLALASFRRRG